MTSRKIFTNIGAIMAGIFPIFGVLFLKWDILAIILYYWIDAVILGIFNILKIHKAEGTIPTRVTIDNESLGNRSKSQLIFDFIFIYLLALIVLGGTMVKIFGIPSGFSKIILSNIVIITVNHFLIYVIDFVGKQEFKNISPSQQMMKIYPKVLIVYFPVVIVGRGMGLVVNNGLAPLILLVTLTTLADLYYLNKGKDLIENKKVATFISRFLSNPDLNRLKK